MIYKSWHGFCLCGEEADFPSEAQVVSSPFAPLVFLVWRDPMKHRGYFAIHSLEELTEEESIVAFVPVKLRCRNKHRNRWPNLSKSMEPVF